MKFLSLFSILFLVIGCSSLGEKFVKESSIDERKSLVYVYRVNRFMGAAGSPYVCLNGKVVAEAVNGGYFPLEIEPGRHKLSLVSFGNNLGGVNFFTQKGNIYYLRYDVTMFNGASESARATRQASLSNGGGAIGAGMGAVFESNRSEIKKIASNLDKRAQKTNFNTGFVFIKPRLGRKEIAETNQFTAPNYSKNHCKTKDKAKQL